MTDQRPSVIVTGSSGLLGRPVCRRLAEAGYSVFGFDRVGLPEPPKELEHVCDVECDLSDSTSVRVALQQVHQKTGGKLASVVHMAAYYDFSGEDSPLYEDVTVHGTDRLLNGLEAFQLEQFLFTSTMLIHAPCPVGEHIREDDPLQAKWPYPQSKIDTEKLIRVGHPNVRSVFLRIGGVYTDFGRQPTLVQQIKRIYEKDLQGHFYPGDMDAGQSPVHVSDVVDAIIKTVDRRNQLAPQTAILIGEPDPPSYGQLQELIAAKLHGRDWATLHVPKAIAKVGAAVTDACQGGDAFIKPFMVDMADDNYALDISQAKRLLDWQPQYRLIDVLPTILQSLKNAPDVWYQKNGLS
ncbi:NAD-dependent epimerase/dehydratase family protein [Rhodopirellula sp. MGV]|uniref:NAD-dependent epimerase/dehydratase family protein n=1 Tax=Rhodopirellula sp. MGV TaxID=2023130 RepID=UPI000B96810D|nr:NAD(P)-dependent oxidoreductase [Rhodopirellula sp. MGV]OYP32955.1 UDP-glucose 4-epimerase [Rhodopirellula sp. MGV]PNY35388.1 NAD(P)-dependent oxidoreductase [Rhodopirellula baltica]